MRARRHVIINILQPKQEQERLPKRLWPLWIVSASQCDRVWPERKKGFDAMQLSANWTMRMHYFYPIQFQFESFESKGESKKKERSSTECIWQTWIAFSIKVTGNWLPGEDNNRSIGMHRHQTHDNQEKNRRMPAFSKCFLQRSSTHTETHGLQRNGCLRHCANSAR